MIQNVKSISYLPTYTDEYLLQSLANLGQRIGLKGDNVTYSSFTFKDIFDEELQGDLSSKIGVLHYEDDENGTTKGKFYLIDKGKKFDKNASQPLYIEDNVFHTQMSSNNLSFDMLSGNTKEITNDSMMKMNSTSSSTTFSSILYKVILGKENDDTNNLEIEYSQYDTSTNTLLRYANAFYLYNDGVSNYYAMIVVDQIDESKYEMKVYLFNSSFLTQSSDSVNIKTEFENSFSLSTYNQNNIFFQTLQSLDINDATQIFNYQTNVDCTIFGMIMNNVENKELNHNDEVIELLYNGPTTTFSLSDNMSKDDIQQSVDILSKDGLSLDARLSFLNTEITYLYPIILRYYSDHQYSSVLSTLSRRIICNLYEYLYSTQKSKGSDYNVMYIPLSYQFTYLSNDNQLKIYFSSTIPISFEDLSSLDDSEIESYFSSVDTITFDYAFDSKVKIVNFEVKYNQKYNDCINGIVITSIYTAPYINALYNWVINDIDTNVSALGKDAGNPNIIFIYSTKDSYQILSSSNVNIQKNTTFIQDEFIVNNELVNSQSTTMCKCWVPEITSSNVDFFYQSIIINMSTKDCIESSIESDMKMFTSFWVVTNENGKVKFNYIKDPSRDGSALDLSIMMNVDGILSELVNNYHNTSNEFNMIMLNAINDILYQETVTNSKMNWCIFKNKLASEYSDEYLNDLNLSIQYNDTVTKNTGQNTTITQSELYLKGLNHTNMDMNEDSPISVTNALYPHISVEERTREVPITTYTIEDVVSYQDEYANTELIQQQAELYQESVISSDKVSTVQKKVISSVSYISETYYENVQSGYYQEYVFNDNVPMVDGKEIFLRNQNLLNRLNIITLSKLGKLYYSYIGSSYEDEDKTILHLGTSSTNINIGSDTLVSEEAKSYFNPQSTLSIDFDNIILNSKNVTTYKNIVARQKVSTIEYYTLMLKPVGKIYLNGGIRFKYNSGEGLSQMMMNDIVNTSQAPSTSTTVGLSSTTTEGVSSSSTSPSTQLTQAPSTTTPGTTTPSGTTPYPITAELTLINGNDLGKYSDELFVPIYNADDTNQSTPQYYCIYLNNLADAIMGKDKFNAFGNKIYIEYNRLKNNYFSIRNGEEVHYFIPIYSSQKINFQPASTDKVAILNDFFTIEFHTINNYLYLTIDNVKEFDDSNDANFKYKKNYEVLTGESATSIFGGASIN